jgi:arylsulfatase A-like enzyme
LLVGGVAVACGEDAPPPNIVFIYIDDLGWRDIGVMGTEYYETPNVDALASQGMLFTNAYANAPNCAPSRASLLTGYYTPRHGIYTVNSAARGDTRLRKLIPVDNRTDLDTAFVTIAEVLQSAGYVTGHVGKWHLGGEGSLPTDHGFDWAVAGNDLGSPASYFFPYANATRRIPDLGSSGEEGEYLTDRLTTEAIGFIRVNTERPFFLYLSHYAVHTPLRAKPDLIEHYREKAAASGHDNPTYAAMVHSVDESVGRVMDVLDDLGLADRTLVVFYSDNGGYGPATSMAPLRGSKGMLYEGGIRVPLVVSWPGQVEPGSRSESPVVGTDLFPTILDIADVPRMTFSIADGLSLLPLLRQQGDLPARPLYWHFPAYLEAYRSMTGPWRTTPASAIRIGDYKLITFFEDQRIELYDLVNDIGEQRDISVTMPEKVVELEAQLRSWWQRVGAWIPTVPNPEFDPEAAQGE